MLLIGTVVSLITAVAATRAMLGLLAGFRWFAEPELHGRDRRSEIPRWQQIDVVTPPAPVLHHLARRRRRSASLAIVVQGLNLGIDFKGGVQITFTTPKPTSLAHRARPDRRDRRAATRSSRAAARRRASDSLQELPDPAEEARRRAEQDKLTNDAHAARSHAEKLGVKNVSASFSRQILDGAILAIFVSFALIALYVTIRFRWRFAVPILAHARQRHPDHARRLRDLGPRGERGHGRRDPDDPRLLGLRHDHRLRPRPREHAADAARERSRRSSTSRSPRC